MRRREFITFLGSAVAWPLAANGQQLENPVRIGFLPLGSPSDVYDRLLVEAFRDGLRKAGVVENRHVVLDFAWVRTEPELPAGSLFGPISTKSLYMTGTRFTPSPSSMNLFSDDLLCTNTTSASPCRPVSSA